MGAYDKRACTNKRRGIQAGFAFGVYCAARMVRAAVVQARLVILPPRQAVFETHYGHRRQPWVTPFHQRRISASMMASISPKDLQTIRVPSQSARDLQWGSRPSKGSKLCFPQPAAASRCGRALTTKDLSADLERIPAANSGTILMRTSRTTLFT